MRGKRLFSFILPSVTLMVLLAGCAVDSGKPGEDESLTVSYAEATPAPTPQIVENSSSLFSVEVEEIKLLNSVLNNGTNKKAQTSNAKYYFHIDWTDDDCVNWAKNAEIILTIAAEKYGFENPGEPIVFFKNDSRYIITASKIYLKMDEAGTTGALVQHLSEQRLPAWLCTGLELYWLDALGAEVFPGELKIDKNTDIEAWLSDIRGKGLPEFGDLWFLPGYIEDEALETAPQIAYAFVKYLDKNGLLDSVVQMYLETPYLSHTVMMATAEWRGFFGGAINNSGYERTYFATYGIPINKKIRTTLIAPMEYGIYYFDLCSLGDEINYNTIEMLIDKSDGGIKYASDWLGVDFDYENPFIVLMYTETPSVHVGRVGGHLDELNHQGKVMSGMTVYDIFLWDGIIAPATASHEAIHALVRRLGMTTNFPAIKSSVSSLTKVTGANYLEEGFAEFVRFGYANEVGLWDSMFEPGTFTTKVFHNNTADNFNRIIDETGIKFFEDVQKLYDNAQLAKGNKTAYTKLCYLYSYESAMSFVAYLVEEAGTKEDFKIFFQNILRGGAIYGKDIDDLIADWLDFIGVSF